MTRGDRGADRALRAGLPRPRPGPQRAAARPTLEAHNANYVGGDINGGAADLRQLVRAPGRAPRAVRDAQPAPLRVLVVDPARRRRPRHVRLARGPRGAARRAALTIDASIMPGRLPADARRWRNPPTMEQPHARGRARGSRDARLVARRGRRGARGPRLLRPAARRRQLPGAVRRPEPRSPARGHARVVGVSGAAASTPADLAGLPRLSRPSCSPGGPAQVDYRVHGLDGVDALDPRARESRGSSPTAACASRASSRTSRRNGEADDDLRAALADLAEANAKLDAAHSEGGRARQDRSSDRRRQPAARRRRAERRCSRRRRGRLVCCCSTSTTSRWSTTATATASATRCWSRSSRASSAPRDRKTSSPAGAARSSCSSAAAMTSASACARRRADPRRRLGAAVQHDRRRAPDHHLGRRRREHGLAQSPDPLVDAADAALLEAKRAGKNRTVIGRLAARHTAAPPEQAQAARRTASSAARPAARTRAPPARRRRAGCRTVASTSPVCSRCAARELVVGQVRGVHDHARARLDGRLDLDLPLVGHGRACAPRSPRAAPPATAAAVSSSR